MLSHRSQRSLLCTGLAAGAIALLAGAADAHVVVLLDRQLKAQTVDVVRIAAGKVTFTSPTGGEERSMPLDQVAAIVEPAWWAAELSPARIDQRTSESVGLVELTDGRMITGRLDAPIDPSSESAADPPKDLLRWEHSPVLGRMEFKLDEVRRVRFAGEWIEDLASDGVKGPLRDTLILSNGDRLTGLVERIGSEVWVSDAGAMTKTPYSRVREIRLVNPPTPPTGTLIWLQGGTVTRVEHIGADPQRGLLLGFEPSEGKSRQVFAATDQVRALLPDKQRFHPLSSLTIAAQRIAPGRAASLEPAHPIAGTGALLDTFDIDLPGPMSVDWTLPDNAARIAGWLVLPFSCYRWGDCVVRLEALGRDGKATLLGEEPISATRTGVPINAAIPRGSATLRVTVDEGRYGPIQDRVILHRFVISR